MTASAGVSRLGVMGKIYFVQSGARPLVKIGWTIDVALRLATLQCGNPDALHLLGTVPGSVEDERAWHARFRALSVRGEWFSLDDDLTAAIARRRVIAKEILLERYPPPAPFNRDDAIRSIISFRAEQARGQARKNGSVTGLDDAKVAAILSDRRSVRAIAREYGVGAMTIHNIRSRKTWRHVAPALTTA